MAKNKQGQEVIESKEAPPLAPANQAADSVKLDEKTAQDAAAGSAELDQTEMALLRDENTHLQRSVTAALEEVAALKKLLDEARSSLRPVLSYEKIEKRYPGFLDGLDGLFDGVESYGDLPLEALGAVDTAHATLLKLVGDVAGMRSKLQQAEILELQARDAKLVAERPTLRILKDTAHSVGGGMTTLRPGTLISARTYGLDFYDRLSAHLHRSFPQNFVVVAAPVNKPAA